LSDDEYEAFVRYLFEEHVRPRLPLIRRRFRGPHFEDEFTWAFDQLRDADRVVNFINATSSFEDPPYEMLTPQGLARTIAKAESGVRFHNRMAGESGVSDALDSHFEALASGLRQDSLPPQEAEALRSLGFDDVAEHINGIVYAVRTTAQDRGYGTNEVPVSRRLTEVEERLDRAEEEHRGMAQESEERQSSSEPRRKSRRWFKGLGQIIQGAAMSLANIALAAGMLPLPVSPETRTWGSLASATAGIGTLLNGIGDLRGE